ncbi:hypothetical protein AcW1_003433 [Taiwanofungus camphoratus]|nr:hypothetical protein AcV5_002108 [Antrodia cinnamomea]KAI0941573.1 hypothetical protein AcW1_003433 [Antrodia cinnamomea]KAI0943931.1 hypothetical protein AcV7_001882 [Antrodia cinnamomea]
MKEALSSLQIVATSHGATNGQIRPMWRLHLPSLRAFEPHFQLRMASGFQACYVPLVEDDDFDKQMDGLQGPSGLPATKPLTIRIPARAMINMRIPSIPADEGILVDEDMIDGIPSEDGPGGTLTAGLSTSAPTKSSPRRTPARRGRRSYSGALAQSRADQSYPDVFQSISCSPGIRGWSFEELRLECYRISLVATGQLPRPVAAEDPRWAIIPPIYTPFVQHPPEMTAERQGPVSGEQYAGSVDVIMSQEPTLACAFTFSA